MIPRGSPDRRSEFPDLRNPEAGAGMIGIIAMLGLIFALVQGTLFYRSRESARFLAKEKNKILALQVAEAGVEENIADLGSRKLVAAQGMDALATYTAKQLGSGTFTTRLTTLAAGGEADTVLLSSQGLVASATQSVAAKLRIRRYVDTSRTPVMKESLEVAIDTTEQVVETITYTTEVQDPEAMPPLDETAAYAACMASGAKKCDVCHIPNGNPDNRHVIDVSKSAIHTHISHHGDYVTTDGTCDIYNPRQVPHVTTTTVELYDTTVIDHTVYDTVVVIDTLAKVQILSWK